MKEIRYCHSLCLAFLFLFSISLKGQIRLASLFTDNMVLQQKSNAAIWGWSSPGKLVTVRASWDRKQVTTNADARGRWKVFVKTPSAGGPYSLTVSDGKAVTLQNILIGEVWVCAGQSNMDMPMKGFVGQPITGANAAILKSGNKNIRIYNVPRDGSVSRRDNSLQASWKEAEPQSVSGFSATAYYFGKELEEVLKVPVGLVLVGYGGSTIESWMGAETLKAFPDIKLPFEKDSLKRPSQTPTALYNAMLHPIIGYRVKGMIWYQGESNFDHADEYESLFPLAVKEWRSEWEQGDFPFYYAQIAPFDYRGLAGGKTDAKFNSAFLRDAQRKCVSKLSNVGMAVLLDLGEEKCIHPARKQEAAQRLAFLALSKTYLIEGFEAESPEYESLAISAGVATIHFKNSSLGLTSYNKPLTLFEIAGEDKVFHPASARISKNSVSVSSPLVKEPVAVRYAFKNFVNGELFNTYGLPASSFRTDNW